MSYYIKITVVAICSMLLILLAMYLEYPASWQHDFSGIYYFISMAFIPIIVTVFGVYIAPKGTSK